MSKPLLPSHAPNIFFSPASFFSLISRILQDSLLCTPISSAFLPPAFHLSFLQKQKQKQSLICLSVPSYSNHVTIIYFWPSNTVGSVRKTNQSTGAMSPIVDGDEHLGSSCRRQHPRYVTQRHPSRTSKPPTSMMKDICDFAARSPTGPHDSCMASLRPFFPDFSKPLGMRPSTEPPRAQRATPI
jgi:hypothetical protein